METIENISDTIIESYNEYKNFMINSVMTSIALLVALAWNDVVQSLVNLYYPDNTKKTMRGKIYYAILITFIVFIVQIYIAPHIVGADK